jgi:hypothetical protein
MQVCVREHFDCSVLKFVQWVDSVTQSVVTVQGKKSA